MPEQDIKPVPTPAEKIDEFLNALPEEDNAEPTPAPTPVETPVATPPASSPSAEPTAPKQPETLPAPPAPTPVAREETPATPPEPAAPKLFADKYENRFDLINGTLELVKANEIKGDDRKAVIALLEEADTTKDYSKVEAKYKELQATRTRQIEAERSATPPPPAPTEPTPPVNEPPVDIAGQPEKVKQFILSTAFQEFRQTSLAKYMERNGIEIPTTDEQLAELEDSNRPVWREFIDTFRPLVANNKKFVDDFSRSQAEAPVHNNSQKQKAKTEIEASIKELGIEMKPEEIDAAIDEAIKQPWLYEDKNGSSFLRDNALVDYFTAKKLRGLVKPAIERIRSEAKTEGAARGAQAVIDGKAKEPPRASNSSLPPTQHTVRPIDFSDKKQARAAGPQAREEALEAELAKL
jgi:hypothetical protein